MAQNKSIPASLILWSCLIAMGVASAEPLPVPDTSTPSFPGLPQSRMLPRQVPRDPMGQSPAGVFGQEQGKPRKAEVPPPKPLSPTEKAEAIRKALAPRPPAAEVRRHTLDDLYTKLAAARDEDEAKGLAALIGGLWMRSDSDTADLLMQRAAAAVAAKDYPLALNVLDCLVDIDPHWAEAWNKRATVRFLAGDYDGSMDDIGHVLKLEPRHFGALEGMAAILERTGFEKHALEIYRRALAIYPHQEELEKVVEKLTLSVEGQGI